VNGPQAPVRFMRELIGARRQLPAVVRSLGKVLPQARSYYGRSYAGLALRALRLLRRRFLPEEAYQLGLFDPSLEQATLDRYLSKSALKQIQNRLNPLPWVGLVEDKGVFYRLCRTFGLPIPELYAIVYRDRPGWAAGKRAPRSRRDWEEFLESELPPEFIVKPACGVYGRGVTAYARSERGFRSSTGDLLDARELLSCLQADPRDQGVILQERLWSHPVIAQLSGTEALQTLRVDAVSTTEGPRIMHAGLKIIRGGNLVDNLDRGATGNFIMQISLHDGRVLHGRAFEAGRPGFLTISHHPITGQLLSGTRIPCWEEVRQVALQAMDLFRPLKAVGWDIAVAGDGVRVIEGNAWSDPPLLLQGAIRRPQGVREPADFLSRLYSGTGIVSVSPQDPPPET